MTAVLSDCGRYRYRLERTIAAEGLNVVVIMVNPSTADAVNDDPTIKKLIGFGVRNNWAKITVGNLFAYRATDVSELAKAVDPIGPLNDNHLLTMIMQCDFLLVAWGRLDKLPRRYRAEYLKIWRMAELANRAIHCFGVCQDGHPKHPVMIAYASQIEQWKGA